MDDFDKICLVAASILCVITLSASGCTIHRNNKIVEMVRNGADPIKAACALRSDGNDAICVIAANK